MLTKGLCYPVTRLAMKKTAILFYAILNGDEHGRDSK